MFKTIILITISLLIPANISSSNEVIHKDIHKLSTEEKVEEEVIETIDFKELTNQIVYGYSSEVAQTDNSPFITASLFNLRDSNSFEIVANNCYPFGTRVNINGHDLIVQDRMNSRYDCNTWDIWFKDKQEALTWGKRKLTIKVYD